MNVEEVLPDELVKTLNSYNFDDEAGLFVESINYSDDNFSMQFSIRFDPDKNLSNHLWLVTACGIETLHTVINWTQEIKLYRSHILLLEYIDSQTELYFNGTTNCPQELFIDLQAALIDLAGNDTDGVEYIIPFLRIKELSQQGYGLFARGPKTIMNLYAHCLKKFDIKSNFIGYYKPTEANKSLKLFQLGYSYVIGHTIKFERLL